VNRHLELRDELARVIHRTFFDAGNEPGPHLVTQAANRCVHVAVLLGLLPELREDPQDQSDDRQDPHDRPND
jgi:hypothetical protein